MNQKKFKAPLIWMAAVLLLAFAGATTYSQTNAQNQNSAPATQPTNTPAQNLPAQLNFTPQQEQQWREINREFRSQEMTATFKVRQARLALNDAMEAANPNEEQIKQRAKDLADAQSAVTQLQALRQARVLQLLTPEQRIKLKELRERAQEMRRERQNDPAFRQRELKRNPNAPGLTPAQRKALKQQQQVKPKP